MVGALKHLQLHKSNIQMTANVDTPLVKTLGHQVSIGPKTIDLCPNLALCGKDVADLVRSGLVHLHRQGCVVYMHFFTHQSVQQKGDDTQNTVSKG